MEILPKNLGTRPRLAVEIRPEGVVAARAEDAAALLSAVADCPLREGAFTAGLKPGGLIDGNRIVAAIRETLDAVASRGERTRYVTLVIPDAAARVLLLEFDELPAKEAEGLPIVRFRLKKLVPFDVDHAMVSYQVMSNEGGMVRVLAVAIPGDVLAEYEGAVASAGYAAGAVLPSTLAALAALDESSDAVLVVNASRAGVTTAIVREGTLLLHRSLELVTQAAEMATVPGSLLEEEYCRIEREAQSEPHMLRDVDEERMDAREIAQAVSVAAAYFEDSLSVTPEELISAGPVGADALRTLLEANGIADLRVHEAVSAEGLTAGAGARVQRGWLAGVRGALRN